MWYHTKLTVEKAKETSSSHKTPVSQCRSLLPTCLVPIAILNEAVSSDHGLIAATISAIRDAQMDKAVLLWRCSLVHTSCHLSCQDGYLDTFGKKRLSIR